MENKVEKLQNIKEEEDIIIAIESPIDGEKHFSSFNTSVGMNIKSHIEKVHDLQDKESSIIEQIKEFSDEKGEDIEKVQNECLSIMENIDKAITDNNQEKVDNLSEKLEEKSNQIPQEYIDLSSKLNDINKKLFETCLESVCMILNPCKVEKIESDGKESYKYTCKRDVGNKKEYYRQFFEDAQECYEIISLFLDLSGSYIGLHRESKIKIY